MNPIKTTGHVLYSIGSAIFALCVYLPLITLFGKVSSARTQSQIRSMKNGTYTGDYIFDNDVTQVSPLDEFITDKDFVKTGSTPSTKPTLFFPKGKA